MMADSPSSKPSGRSLKARFVRLFVVAIVLSAVALAYWDLFLRRPIGSGPVGIPVVGDFSSAWSESPVLLLGLGDSITAGFGSSPGRGHLNLIAHSHSKDYPEFEKANLKTLFPNLTLLNRAVSGSTSIDLVEFSLPRLEVQPVTFGIVLITTGGNDVIHDYGRGLPREGAMYGATFEQCEQWFKNYEARLQHVYDEVNARFPKGCEILIANIYDPTDGLGNTTAVGMPHWKDGLRIHARYNKIIEKSVEGRANVHYVDIQTPFMGHGINCRKPWISHYHFSDPHYWYYDNFEDPNDRGYDALRRIYLNELLPILKPRFQEEMPAK